MTATEMPRGEKLKAQAPSRPPAIQPTESKGWARSSATFWKGFLGSALLFAAFPPLDWAPLAWVATLPWIGLIATDRLVGRRPYAALWLAGFIFWLALLQGVRLAHPALYAGWIALAAYLGIYLPLFVGLSRVAVHRWRVPLVFAVPTVWTGLELLRANLFTGLAIGQLAHTQAEYPLLIQLADLAGGYTLTFLIMFVAACLTGARIYRRQRGTWLLAPAIAAIALALVYGNWRLSQTPPGARGPAARVALIQGSLDTVFEISPERARQTMEHYRALTDQAVQAGGQLDLIVWPESMFLAPERLAEEPLAPLASEKMDADELRSRLRAAQADYEQLLASEFARLKGGPSANSDCAWVIGATTFVYGPAAPRMYNSALLVRSPGTVAARYYKMHAVMFGEYIPLADWAPWLYSLTPMTSGLSVGDGPATFRAGNLTMSPSICFESTVPHLIRRHVTKLAQRGEPADALLNITNDGWFWGSAILDLHLRCGVFRAVENRKPLIVAANTGISAHIDGDGRILDRGEKREPKVLLASVQADGRHSPYLWVGDWPAGLCALFCLVLAATGVRRRSATRQPPAQAP